MIIYHLALMQPVDADRSVEISTPAYNALNNLRNYRNTRVCGRGVRHMTLRIHLLLLAFVIGAPAGIYADQVDLTTDHLQRAADLIRKGELGPAEAELGTVLKRSPREPNALNLLGVIRAQQHRQDEAERFFLAAIEANKSLLGAYLNIGRLYLDLANSDRALWAFKEAEKLQPDNDSVNYNLASLYEEKKDYARALAYLNRRAASQMGWEDLFLVIKCHIGLDHIERARTLAAPLKQPGKTPPEIAATIASAFAQHGLVDDAIEILEAANSGTEPSFPLLFNLGATLYQKGERRRAEESFRAALEIEPNDVPTLRALANIARANGELEKALSFLVRARRIAPDSAVVLYDFGWTALNMNLVYDALSALDQLHRMKVADPQYLYPLAIARLNNGESNEAQSLITRYIELRPNDGRGYFVLGATLYAARRFVEARVAFQRSLASISYPDTEYYLGMIAHNEGDEIQAISWFRRALRSDPKNSATHSALGTVLARQKDYEAARAELERAVELDPKDQAAYYQLGLVYGRLGDKSRSRSMFAISEKLRGEQKERQGIGVRLIDLSK
ncbi:MAG: tetratricopeptide repeat protein [Pyrinomonadaceae bacterium]